MKQAPFIFILAVVEAASRADINSCIVGALLAAVSGGFSQIKRAEGGHLTLGEVAAEWGLSGLAGFLVHVAVMKTTSDPWLIWSSCVVAGLAGSKGLAKFLEKK